MFFLFYWFLVLKRGFLVESFVFLLVGTDIAHLFCREKFCLCESKAIDV